MLKQTPGKRTHTTEMIHREVSQQASWPLPMRAFRLFLDSQLLPHSDLLILKNPQQQEPVELR